MWADARLRSSQGPVSSPEFMLALILLILISKVSYAFAAGGRDIDEHSQFGEQRSKTDHRGAKGGYRVELTVCVNSP